MLRQMHVNTSGMFIYVAYLCVCVCHVLLTAFPTTLVVVITSTVGGLIIITAMVVLVICCCYYYRRRKKSHEGTQHPVLASYTV